MFLAGRGWWPGLGRWADTDPSIEVGLSPATADMGRAACFVFRSGVHLPGLLPALGDSG